MLAHLWRLMRVLLWTRRVPMNMANDEERLRSSIDRELALLSGTRERLDWLSEHLVEYVDRLTGFAASPELSIPTVIGSGLFTVVRIAVERFGVELQAAHQPAVITGIYEQLRSSVSSLHAKPCQAELDRLERLVRELRVALTVSSPLFQRAKEWAAGPGTSEAEKAVLRSMILLASVGDLGVLLSEFFDCEFLVAAVNEAVQGSREVGLTSFGLN